MLRVSNIISNMEKIKIYNQLRVYRVSNNISREDLAKEIGINTQTVGYIERNDYCPSLELGLKIANYFKVSVESIFSLKKFPTLGNR